jgi:hypothetical protein
MGKQLTCPRCRAVNAYDVPVLESSAPLRKVPCRSCGHRFDYGFRAEYVTEPEAALSELGSQRTSDGPLDLATEVAVARERLAQHVIRHVDYHDRDRDVLLLYVADMADRLDNELATIKRTLDVIVKRTSR